MTQPTIGTWPPRRILVPLDFSEHSAHALAYAVALAQAAGSTVTVAHVGPPVPPIYSPLPESTAVQANIWNDMLRQREVVLRKEMTEAVAPHVGSGVTFAQEWREGEPATAIAELAAAIGADLVVMGSHGRSGLKRALLGSVAERTARLSACPVLILR